jgi:hypothetical protein
MFMHAIGSGPSVISLLIIAKEKLGRKDLIDAIVNLLCRPSFCFLPDKP